ncbi:MAG: hypothetical protein K6G22_01370 [Lachnospiraceae bacterium]|nr:hypothetical protein [Lachnospiraceae bacterium]
MKKVRIAAFILIQALVIAMLAGCAETDNYEIDRSLLEQSESTGKTAKTSAFSETEKEDEKDDDKEDVSEDDDTELNEDMYKVEPEEVFPLMAEWSYYFTSGVGGWGTELNVAEDGSFSGSFHDTDMGDTGPGYENGTIYICNFSGHFNDYVRSGGPNIYMLSIEDIEYENEPGTEEIEEDIRYIYSEPYGLEGLLGKEDPLAFLDAGTVTSVIGQEEMSWIAPLNFGKYVGVNFDYVEDIPEFLPFAVLINLEDDLVFNGSNITDKNQTFLVNRVKLPGLENTVSELNEDGTYYYEDSDEDECFKVINTCFKIDGYYDCYTKAEEFVPECIEHIYGKLPADDIYPQGPRDSYGMEHDLTTVNGKSSDYMFWSYGKGKNKKWCIGRFLCERAYESDESYVYAYIVETDYDQEGVPDSGFARFYVSSLAFTGLSDDLSSAGEGKGAVRCISAAMSIPEDDSVETKEYIMVGIDDDELIEKYGLQDADFDDDYEAVVPEESEKTYKLAEGSYTPFYVQYPEDSFHKLYFAYDIDEYMGDFESAGMYLYLNEDDEVVYGYEIYTP